MSTAKKATAKRVPRKTAKKTAVKKTVKKTVAKKRASTKAAVKKKAVKKVAKKPATKTTKKAPKKRAPKKTVKKETAKNDELVSKTVTLPTDAGPRLEAKVGAMQTLLDHMHVPVYRIAYVSAICFVLVGLMTIISEYIHVPGAQSAQVCTSINCPVDQPNTIDTTQTQVQDLEPEFHMLDLVPSIINEQVRLNFKVQHGQNIDVQLLSTAAGGLYPVNYERLSNENFRFTIPGDSLPPDDYEIKIFVTKLDDTGTYAFPGGEFSVPEPEVIVDEEEIEVEEETTDETEDETEENTQTEAQEEDDEVDENSSTVEQNELEEEDETENDEDDSLDDETIETVELQEQKLENKTPEPVTVDDANVDFISTAPVEVEEKFVISVTDSIFSAREAIRVFAPNDHQNIELYIRSELSIDSRFLGAMTKEFDRWIYSFDTNNLPNGSYELFAQAVVEDGVSISDSINVLVQNVAVEEEPVRLPVLEEEDVSAGPERNFYLFEDNAEERASSSVINTLAAEETEELINESRDDIDELLKRYAVARQSDNELLVDAIEEEFNNKRDSLLTEALRNDDTRNITSEIDAELNERFTELKERVDTFESIRSSRSDERVSTDSDGDGISDYDEEVIYKTDPNNADTDQDGFIDGAEVARGFNPTDPAAETIVQYELPQETVGLTRNDVLTVSSVKPLVDRTADDETERVFAEISGVGLPNSFVTIYIFSTPIIVTVKTDADGAFVYQFDKELEDGEHDVYVAFTDNSGAILAHSEPFQFVKEAQAFTPVDAAEETVVVTAPSVVETSTINAIRLVLAMSILVLGFILLMLGINLRNTERSLKSQ